jgi:hypothetical protein
MAGAFAVLFFIGLVILFFLSGVGNELKLPLDQNKNSGLSFTQRCQQRLGLSQVRRIKPFGEPVVDFE